MHNLCIVKKVKSDISVSHRYEIAKGGGHFKESKLPKGLSAMVSYVKRLNMNLGTDQTYISIWCWWW